MEGVEETQLSSGENDGGGQDRQTLEIEGERKQIKY